MNLTINGDAKTFADERIDVAALLKLQSVEYADMVSVQLNDGFVRRPDYETTFLKEGDTVNFLYFMGGGR